MVIKNRAEIINAERYAMKVLRDVFYKIIDYDMLFLEYKECRHSIMSVCKFQSLFIIFLTLLYRQTKWSCDM